MPESRRPRRWDEFRRSVAIAGIAAWFLVGALPLIGLTLWWVRGDATPAKAVVQFVLPAILQTASMACAIGVLRDLSGSVRLTWWQVGLFFAGLAIYLTATAVYLQG